MSGIVVFVNPRSGRGRTAEVWEAVRGGQARLRDAVVICVADRDRAAAALADALRQPVDRVLVVGGDGTMHLVANVVLEQPAARRPALAVLPAGTGSDLARTLRIPTHADRAARLACDGAARPLDVLRLETVDGRRRHVLNVASAGISGLVDEAVNALPRRTTLSYLGATLGAVFRYRPAPCRVSVDGEPWHNGPVLLVAVANGPCFGRGMRVAPDARVDDGLADVVLVQPVARWALPFRLPQIYRGSHVRLSFVRASRGRTVTLEPAPGFPAFDLDGEVFPAATVTITVMPAALQVIAGEKTAP
ncbi:MAG: diacylglycerol kinase family lipid kinase [Gemmatimonadota bacterium]|nr:diacylglycerol kinase family lipid kinase [Gemmatimonadota bacterium]